MAEWPIAADCKSAGLSLRRFESSPLDMLLLIKKKATEEEIKQMAEDFEGYIKLVIDVEREILAGGGERHFDGEQKLLVDGSKQEDLWGGGID